MVPQICTRSLAALFALSCFCAVAFAQDKPAASEVVPLTIPAGVALHVVLEKTVPIKHAGVPVEGRLTEPIYVFDRMVVPAGSEVLGHVNKVEGVPRIQRARAIANGDFTPLRKGHIDFETLVLKDGRRLALHTDVSEGTLSVVHLTAGGEGKKKGRVGGAVEQARQQVKQRVHETVEQIKAPNKMHRLEQQFKTMVLAELPYHRQSLPAGTHFTAELNAPLELGTADCPPVELEQLGGEIPTSSTVHVRLVTPLDSAIDHKGETVEAVVSEPLFSSDHHLILPEGTRLKGEVTQAVAARRLSRSGRLRFTFHQVELPQGMTRKVEASLQGVEVAGADHVALDEEGGARAVTPKTHYIAPAINVLLATSSLDGLDHHRDFDDPPRGPDTTGGAVRGGAGFGLIGTIAGLTVHSRPVSSGFAFYGAAWSVYSHIMTRGTDVVFPKNTPMEIGFGSHQGPPDVH